MDSTTLLIVLAAVALVAVIASQSKNKGSKCSGDLLAETNAWRSRCATACRQATAVFF